MTAFEDYANAGGEFGSQVNYLIDNGASDARLATAVLRLSTGVADAARAWVVALDAADPVPPDRPDVMAAAAVLHETVVATQQAYAAVAACGEDAACQNGAFGAVNSSLGNVNATLDGLPDA